MAVVRLKMEEMTSGLLEVSLGIIFFLGDSASPLYTLLNIGLMTPFINFGG